MKRIVVVSFALILQGLNSFGQTNVTPPKGHAVSLLGGQEQKASSQFQSRVVSATPSAQPVEPAAIRRMSREGVLLPKKPKKDFGTALEDIFRPQNDQMGETCIRDTVVTIYPPGR